MLGLADFDEQWPRMAEVARSIIDDGSLTVENVRDECRAGRALCFASADGVAVVTLVPNRATQGLELCVLLAVSIGPHGAVEAYLPELEQVARDLGADRMVFYTRRRGWERRLDAAWRLRHVAYEREIRHGGTR
jgi:hypothetical protein